MLTAEIFWTIERRTRIRRWQFSARIKTSATARVMKGHVLDAVIAPGYDEEALGILKAKKHGTFLILRTRGPLQRDHGIDMVRVLGGVLLQTTEFPEPNPSSFKVVTAAADATDTV